MAPKRRRPGAPAPTGTGASTGAGAGSVSGSGTTARSGPAPTPRWWVPTMLAIMIVGLLWIVVFYLSSNLYPLPQLGSWNLAVGFGLIIVGFAMTTRWR